MNRPPRPGPFEYLATLELIGIKFGLENIRALVAYLGNPELKYRTIHVAGTNGKGSVTVMTDAALRAAGHFTARYTSPHLVELNERFVIDGRPVSTRDLENAIEDVRGAVERLRARGVLDVEPTYFEVTTAVAFELFRRARVEVAVMEVGLGGRLDATNVVAPMATAITTIGFDHEKYLGGTLREIAAEKAGIIKPGVPVVVGDVAAEAFDAIEAIARAQRAPLIRAAADALERAGVVELGLRGRHQELNAAVAVTLLQTVDRAGLPVPADAIRGGLRSARWPGRLELRTFADGREALLDAAHNPEGAAALAAYLRETRPDKPPLVFAAMRDKEVRGMFRVLLPEVGRLILTRASNSRSAEPEDLAAAAREVAPALPVAVEPSRPEALALAWRASPRIVVAGSIFLLGDIMRELDGS